MSSATNIAADVAIIGAGAAGLAAALSLNSRLRVAVFAKRTLGKTASAKAQGGIAAAVGGDDDFNLHIKDSLYSGDGLCKEEAVREVVTQAPAAVRWLNELGVAFNRSDKGTYDLALEGGHSRRRVLHVDDYSGRAILSALTQATRTRQNITVYENRVAVDLVIAGGRCHGFYALRPEDGGVEAVTASVVLLATGGGGRVYLYSTTPEDATGDGIAMAFRAGCRISNMEFIQFHPTCLFHPQPPTLLISEAVRGEGARLVNADGDSFTAAAHPDGDLAPRDIVARAIDAEMKRSGDDCVYLDGSGHDAEFWRRRFPMIFRQCQERGIHLPADHIPVVPAAHYSCGGVLTDLNGRSNIAGLYAVGETADIGLHGANRLASNSLLECIVLARRFATHVAIPPPPPPIAAWDEHRISPPREEIMVSHNWEELRRIMWNYVGIVRRDERLQRARRRVEWIKEEISEYYRRHKVTRDFLELRNLTQCAELIIEGALARRESRGLHYNLDCLRRSPHAVDTRLDKTDFDRRHRAVNRHCPFSGRLITASSCHTYRRHTIGFCNPDCRDDFARNDANNFHNATPALTAAKAFFDSLIDRQLTAFSNSCQ